MIHLDTICRRCGERQGNHVLMNRGVVLCPTSVFSPFEVPTVSEPRSDGNLSVDAQQRLNDMMRHLGGKG